MDLVGRYLDLVEAEVRRDPEMREGQAHYVALCREWPHFHERIAGTERDCFSLDRNLPAFLAWVEEALAAEQRAAEGVGGIGDAEAAVTGGERA